MYNILRCCLLFYVLLLCLRLSCSSYVCLRLGDGACHRLFLAGPSSQRRAARLRIYIYASCKQAMLTVLGTAYRRRQTFRGSLVRVKRKEVIRLCIGRPGFMLQANVPHSLKSSGVLCTACSNNRGIDLLLNRSS